MRSMAVQGSQLTTYIHACMHAAKPRRESNATCYILFDGDCKQGIKQYACLPACTRRVVRKTRTGHQETLTMNRVPSLGYGSPSSSFFLSICSCVCLFFCPSVHLTISFSLLTQSLLSLFDFNFFLLNLFPWLNLFWKALFIT